MVANFATVRGLSTNLFRSCKPYASLNGNTASNLVGVRSYQLVSSSHHKLNSHQLPKNEKGETNVVVAGTGNTAHVLIGYIGGRDDLAVNVFEANRKRADEAAKIFKDNTMWDIKTYGKGLNGMDVKNLLKQTNIRIPKGISVMDVTDSHEVTVGYPSMVTHDARKACRDANVFLLAVPSHVKRLYLEYMAPFIQPGSMIGTMSTTGGFDLLVRDVLGEELANSCLVFGLERTPWNSSVAKDCIRVDIKNTRPDLHLAVHDPAHLNYNTVGVLQNFFGHSTTFYPVTNFMATSLLNARCILHTCSMYASFGQWDGKQPFDKAPGIYEEALFQEVKPVAHACSMEVMDVAEQLLEHMTHSSESTVPAWDAFDSALVRVQENIKSGQYDDVKHAMMLSNEAKGLVPDTTAPMWYEDVTHGLVVIRGIADLANVKTPNIDNILTWCQGMMGVEYLVDGKFVGKDIAQSFAPQAFGFDSLDSFLDNYRHSNNVDHDAGIQEKDNLAAVLAASVAAPAQKVSNEL